MNMPKSLSQLKMDRLTQMRCMRNKSDLLVILIEAYVPLPYEHLHDHHEDVHISLITVNLDLK